MAAHTSPRRRLSLVPSDERLRCRAGIALLLLLGVIAFLVGRLLGS